MSKFAVFIATTGGPIHVERLTEEQAPQSLICVRRSSTILDVSGDYDDFVKLGSGVIEREFGPFEGNSFRVDVSEPIETGTSWQLPMFLAHAIQCCDGVSLTDQVEEADFIVWGTGHVDYDLNVTSVEHIYQKISGSKSFIQSLRQDPQKIIFTAPTGRNFDQLIATPEFLQFRHIACKNALDLVTELKLPVKSRTVSVPKNKLTKTKSHNRYSPLWPALVFILGVISLASFSDLSRWADFWSTVDENKQIITGSQNNVKINSITQKVTTNEFITEIAALRPLPGIAAPANSLCWSKSASRGPTARQQWPTS